MEEAMTVFNTKLDELTTAHLDPWANRAEGAAAPPPVVDDVQPGPAAPPAPGPPPPVHRRRVSKAFPEIPPASLYTNPETSKKNTLIFIQIH